MKAVLTLSTVQAELHFISLTESPLYTVSPMFKLIEYDYVSMYFGYIRIIKSMLLHVNIDRPSPLETC